MELTESEIKQLQNLRNHFPYRVISGVKLPDGSFCTFANSTAAKANNFARKNNGCLFRFSK